MSSTGAEVGDVGDVDARAGSPRLPLLLFGAVELYALVQWLVIGRNAWFYFDEWDFIVDRKAWNLSDLFHSHNGHWVTLPILVYRLLFAIFKLHSYLPYRIVGVVVYLAVAALLLVVIRRAGVNPWIATAAASAFALFGSGWQNVLRPFQITFTGSLAFGLVQLILADHDGELDRRDRLGLLAGLIGLMTSGVAVVMVLIVGGSTLWRRGWRAALFHTVPPFVAYLVWRVAIGHEGDVPHHVAVGSMARFVGSGLRGTIERLGPSHAFGVLIGAVLVLGIVLVFGRLRSRRGAGALVVPFSLLAGTIVFLIVTGTSRAANGSTYALQSRYLSVVVALALPALAVAVDAIASRWRWTLALGIVFLLVGIPHNLHTAWRSQEPLKPLYDSTRRMVLTIPRDPVARQVSPALVPERVASLPLTVGWLLEAARRGWLPPAGVITPREVLADDFRLSFDQVAGPVPARACFTLDRPRVVLMRRGQRIGVSVNPLLLTPAASPALVFPGLVFVPSSTEAVVVVRRAGRVSLSAYQPGGTATEAPAGSWPRICLR